MNGTKKNNNLTTNSSCKSFISVAKIFLLSTLINLSFSYTNPTSCTSTTQYYSLLTLECKTCPTNTVQALDKSYCNCSNSFYQSPDVIGFNDAASCVSLGFVRSFSSLDL